MDYLLKTFLLTMHLSTYNKEISNRFLEIHLFEYEVINSQSYYPEFLA